MALFGEKYGDEVRVIRYGDSVELCGGTHVPNTGNIGMVKIVSESSIAAGIRRIEAITGPEVEKLIAKFQDTIRQMSELFNNTPDILGALRRSIEENHELKQQVEDYFREHIANLSKALLAEAKTNADGIKTVFMRGVRPPEVVKNVAFAIRSISPEKTAFIGATADMTGKPLLTAMFTDDIVASGLNASALVREAAKCIKGGGGGQPGFAQAGGKDSDGLAAAFDKLAEALR